MANYADRNDVLKRLGFESYAAYLDSSLWKSIRKRVQKRDGRTCRICGDKSQGVHHHSYDEATLKGESIEHLFALCRPCHKRIEFNEAGEKYAFSQVRKNLRALLGDRMKHSAVVLQPSAPQHSKKSGNRRKMPPSDQLPQVAKLSAKARRKAIRRQTAIANEAVAKRKKSMKLQRQELSRSIEWQRRAADYYPRTKAQRKVYRQPLTSAECEVLFMAVEYYRARNNLPPRVQPSPAKSFNHPARNSRINFVSVPRSASQATVCTTNPLARFVRRKEAYQGST